MFGQIFLRGSGFSKSLNCCKLSPYLVPLEFLNQPADCLAVHFTVQAGNIVTYVTGSTSESVVEPPIILDNAKIVHFFIKIRAICDM